MKYIVVSSTILAIFMSVGSMGSPGGHGHPRGPNHGNHALPPINVSGTQTTNVSNTNTNVNANVNQNSNSNTNSNSNSNANSNTNEVGNSNTIIVNTGGGVGDASNTVPFFNPTPWGNNPVANPCPPGYYPAYYGWYNFICAYNGGR